MLAAVDRRGWLVTIGIFVTLGAALWSWSAWQAHQEEEAAAERERAREAREEERAERVQRIVEESRALVPDVIEGVALGMRLEDVRRARGPRLARIRRDVEELTLYEELLPNGGQVIYGFSPSETLLVQLQILSVMPTHDAIAPHLAAMNERYGRPTGIWDCPTTGGVPTRRFTWRGSHVTVSDVFLLYGERVSVTLYIATTEQIGRSLRMGGCTPVRAEDIQRFPVATPEQIQASQGGSPAPGGGGTR